MKTDSQLISERLTQLINDRNLTINRLAVLSGLRQSTLNSIYDGSSKNPQVATIVKACNGLGISVRDFFDFPPYNQVKA